MVTLSTNGAAVRSTSDQASRTPATSPWSMAARIALRSGVGEEVGGAVAQRRAAEEAEWRPVLGLLRCRLLAVAVLDDGAQVGVPGVVHRRRESGDGTDA